MGNKKIMSLKRRIKEKIFKLYFSEYNKQNKAVSNHFSDFSDFEKEVIERIKPFTMTSPERIVSLVRAVDYIEKNKISGDIVECGVWKGGSMMAALLSLIENGSKSRQAFLYDTYEGMSEPTKEDRSFKEDSALKAYIDKTSYWERIKCFSTLEEVQNNLSAINYPNNKIHYIKGKVEETIPGDIPDEIAILRLDTDWYESTLHELNYLYPKLTDGGVLIIDDYGHWKGCRKAVDEYFQKHNIQIYLSRIDYTCRIGIKRN
jgi:hypothetical protein